jgi:mannosyltransferase OCH1-like enzyme
MESENDFNNVCYLSKQKKKALKIKMLKQNEEYKIIYKKLHKTKYQTKQYIKKLFIEKKKNKYLIPLKIYQAWFGEIPKFVKETVNLLKKQNPELKHKLFNEAQCRRFIKNNYSKRVLNAYDSIIPHAIKVDLWRYCYLYKYGGIYLDVKYYCINDFKLILLCDKEYFCKDIYTSWHGIYNAILICKPKNKILYKSIKKCIKNIENKKYFSSGLCVTGPLMMKQFFTKDIFDNLELTHEFVNGYNRYINLNNYRVLKYHGEYHKDQQNKLEDHWYSHYKNKNFYK